MPPRSLLRFLLLGFTILVPISAGAAEASAPAPYSLPWRLRPAVPANVIRLDDDLAFYTDAKGNPGITNVAMLLGSVKLGRSFMPFVRIGIIGNWPPTGPSAAAITNFAFGGTYTFFLPSSFRLAIFFGMAEPSGSAQGENPDPAQAAAVRAGILTQSAMDNAMFTVNDLVIFPGVDLAFVSKGLTVQVEATVLQLLRQFGRGDEARTNFTSGLHVGYFPQRWLSLGAELRYQRWLSTPAAVAANKTGASRDNLTLGMGLRFHVKLPGGRFLRPGVSYSRGLDDPMAASGHHILQIDVPIVF